MGTLLHPHSGHSPGGHFQILTCLHTIAERITMSASLDDVLEHVLNAALILTQANAATVRVFDLESGTLNVAKESGFADRLVRQPPVRVGEGMTGMVVKTGRSYRSSGEFADMDRSRGDFAGIGDVEGVLCVPMNTCDNTVGCITVYRTNNRPFTEQDELLLSILAADAVHALEKSRTTHALQTHGELDALTGMSNRRTWLHKVDEEVTRNRRTGHPLSLLVIDVDRLAEFSDNHGRLLGKKLLYDFSRILRDHSRRIDVLGRLSVDEFAILAPQTDTSGALAFAAKMQCTINEFAFLSSRPNKSWQLSCSIGIANFPDDGNTAETLLQKAVDAVNISKRRGYGCVCLGNSANQALGS